MGSNRLLVPVLPLPIQLIEAHAVCLEPAFGHLDLVRDLGDVVVELLVGHLFVRASRRPGLAVLLADALALCGALACFKGGVSFHDVFFDLRFAHGFCG